MTVEQVPGPERPVALTEAARRKVRHLVAEHGGTLRLAVQGGGCSGFQYRVQLDRPHRGDVVYRDHGIDVAVDGDAVPYLLGATLDYSDELMQAGFTFDNPNVAAACGCGSSFRMTSSPQCEPDELNAA